MAKKRRLPSREAAFITSMMHHGFRRTIHEAKLKYKRGYIILSTQKEDSAGIDFWVKLPKSDDLIPVQITQRGIKMFKRYHKPSKSDLDKFIKNSNKRLRDKKKRCKMNGIIFVLISDFEGRKANHRIAWCDIKAFRYALDN